MNANVGSDVHPHLERTGDGTKASLPVSQDAGADFGIAGPHEKAFDYLDVALEVEEVSP